MRCVPFLVFSSCRFRQRVRTQACHPVVNWHKEYHCEHNHHNPNALGSNKQSELRFVPPNNDFKERVLCGMCPVMPSEPVHGPWPFLTIAWSRLRKEIRSPLLVTAGV